MVNVAEAVTPPMMTTPAATSPQGTLVDDDTLVVTTMSTFLVRCDNVDSLTSPAPL
jgi:hypothetical protein